MYFCRRATTSSCIGTYCNGPSHTSIHRAVGSRIHHGRFGLRLDEDSGCGSAGDERRVALILYRAGDADTAAAGGGVRENLEVDGLCRQVRCMVRDAQAITADPRPPSPRWSSDRDVPIPPPQPSSGFAGGQPSPNDLARSGVKGQELGTAPPSGAAPTDVKGQRDLRVGGRGNCAVAAMRTAR